MKATRTLGVIIGALTVCWLPFFIVTFIRPFVCDNPESQDSISGHRSSLIFLKGPE